MSHCGLTAQKTYLVPGGRSLQLPLQLDVGQPDRFDFSLDGLNVSSVIRHILESKVKDVSASLVL